jgi:phosphate/sulfate permease
MTKALPSDHPSHATADPSSEWNVADANYCFRYLLLFNAALLSFAHGANDTANSTAPFSAIFSVYRAGLHSCDDIGTQTEWVLVIAGFFVALGVVLYGENVITTIGQRLSDVDFCRSVDRPPPLPPLTLLEDFVCSSRPVWRS